MECGNDLEFRMYTIYSNKIRHDMIYRLYMGDIFGHGIVSDDATPASDFGIFGNLMASRNNAASI